MKRRLRPRKPARKPVSRSEKLTIRQANFVREYIKDHNGTQAAIRAGYAPKNASVTALQILSSPKIQAELNKIRDAVFGDTEGSVRRIWAGYEAIAFADPAMLFDSHGVMHPIHRMPARIRQAIQSVKVKVERDGHRVMEVRLVPKAPAFSDMARMRGMLREERMVDSQENAIPFSVMARIVEERLQRLESLTSTNGGASTPASDHTNGLDVVIDITKLNGGDDGGGEEE